MQDPVGLTPEPGVVEIQVRVTEPHVVDIGMELSCQFFNMVEPENHIGTKPL